MNIAVTIAVEEVVILIVVVGMIEGIIVVVEMIAGTTVEMTITVAAAHVHVRVAQSVTTIATTAQAPVHAAYHVLTLMEMTVRTMPKYLVTQKLWMVVINQWWWKVTMRHKMESKKL